MTTEKMTVHKALAELKIVDDRIVSAIDGGTYCVANKHSNDKIKGVSLEEYKGKVLLIVNTATGCGFTPQYKELQKQLSCINTL